MERRHLVIEGMDGTGKDTLIDSLLRYPNKRVFTPPFTAHPRASTSIGGPVKDLAGWVDRDLGIIDLLGPQIYNRHPLISEHLYGPYRPDRPTHPLFIGTTWWTDNRLAMGKRSVLIICQPPYATVRETLVRQGSRQHMPGVYDNMRTLYQDYAHTVWPGPTIRYDYTRDSIASLIGLIQKAQAFHG